MKKFYVLGVLLIALFITSDTIAISQVAEIVYIEGNVQVQSAVEKIWKKAELGMQMNIGDSIRTARRSKADIVLDKENKHSVRVEEQTLLVLNSTSPGQINKLDLSNGKVFADVEKMMEGMTFEVSTPSSTAGVRGSAMSVDSNRRRDEIAVFRGEGYLRSFDENKNLISDINIPEGFKASADRFEGPGELTRLSNREMERWNDVKRDLTQRVEGGPVKGEDTSALDSVQDIAETAGEKMDEAKEGIEEKGVEEGFEPREEPCGYDGW